MIKELMISTFFVAICLTSIGQTITDNENQVKQPVIKNVDTSIIAILSFDNTQHWIFKKNKPTDLNADDLYRIEVLLAKCINDYNSQQEKQLKETSKKHPEKKRYKKSTIIDISRYKRQYVATINSKGEKEVWINCFCNAFNLNWRTEMILVKDGGNCYFNLKIDLTSDQYYGLMVNGEG